MSADSWHDVVNELQKRRYEGIGCDIASQHSGVQDDSAVTKMEYIPMDITSAELVEQMLTSVNPEIGIRWPKAVGAQMGSVSSEEYTLTDGVRLNLSEKDQKWLGLKDTFCF